jgi:hypothetical protein
MRVSANGKFGDDKSKKKIKDDDPTALCDEADRGMASLPLYYHFSPDAALRSCSDIVSLAFWRVCV